MVRGMTENSSDQQKQILMSAEQMELDLAFMSVKLMTEGKENYKGNLEQILPQDKIKYKKTEDLKTTK